MVRVANGRLRVGGFTQAGDAVTLTQCDGTTCGATALLAARLLLTEPGTAAALPGQASSARAGRMLQDSLAAAQRGLQRAMNRHARGPLGPLPWTRRLGSTPWAVSAELTRLLRQLGCGVGACTVNWVDDHAGDWPAVVGELRARLEDGVPAVLLTGGPLVIPRNDVGRAWCALSRVAAAAPAIPRHYVLALPWRGAGLKDPGPGHAHIYDPSSGAVRALDLLAARVKSGPGPRELGYWPRVLAVIAPPLTAGSTR